MPRGLAIETSGRIGSLALIENGIALIEEEFPHGLRHAAEIVTRIDALCRSREWGPRELDEIYVSTGPGSFTGLRVGVTVAKTLAFVTGATVVAVPTFLVLARNALPDWRDWIIVLDAKRDQVFTARFTRERDIGGGAGRIVEAEAVHLDSLAAMLQRAPRPVHLIGEGVSFHSRFVPDDPAVIIEPPEFGRARAGVVGNIGAQMARDGLTTAADRLAPLYVRLPEAEEKFHARRSS